MPRPITVADIHSYAEIIRVAQKEIADKLEEKNEIGAGRELAIVFTKLDEAWLWCSFAENHQADAEKNKRKIEVLPKSKLITPNS